MRLAIGVVLVLLGCGPGGDAAGGAEAGTQAVVARSAPQPTAGDKVHGIVLSTHTNGSDWASPDIGTTMEDLRAVGASWVSNHPYARIQADGTVGFRPLVPAAPPPHLTRPIAAAHTAGLQIAVTPHLAYWGSPFRWAGDIEFTSDAEWQIFFDLYTEWVVQLARACPDADGFIFVVDRAKDFLKPSGHRVACKQIEDVLVDLPDVVEASVIGRVVEVSTARLAKHGLPG